MIPTGLMKFIRSASRHTNCIFASDETTLSGAVMKKLLFVLLALAMFTTVSMGCKAEGTIDTRDTSRIGR